MRVCSRAYVRHAVCASGEVQMFALGPPPPEHASSSCMFDDMAPASIQRVTNSPSAAALPSAWHLKPPMSEPQCATPDIDAVMPARICAGSPSASPNEASGSPDHTIGVHCDEPV